MYMSISEILNKDPKKMNDLMIEFNIEPFTSTERLFLQEYIDVMTPIALNNLQKTDCHYGILLPTIFATMSRLESYMDNESLKYCQPLAASLLDGINSRFAHIIDFNSETAIPAIISTCTHPHFKLGWLGKHKTASNKEKIKSILLNAAEEVNVHGKPNSSNINEKTEISTRQSKR